MLNKLYYYIIIVEQIRLYFLLLAATLVLADLPIDCRFQDAVGVWYLRESARTADLSEPCTALGEVGQPIRALHRFGRGEAARTADLSEPCSALGEVSGI